MGLYYYGGKNGNGLHLELASGHPFKPSFIPWVRAKRGFQLREPSCVTVFTSKLRYNNGRKRDLMIGVLETSIVFSI